MHQFLKIRPSKIQGSGVFSEKEINEDEKFYFIPISDISYQPQPHWAKIGRLGWVNDPNVLNWINHSCNPNAQLITNEIEPFLKSVKEIKEGEEITVNYNLTEIEGIKILCNCKDINCDGFFLRIE